MPVCFTRFTLSSCSVRKYSHREKKREREHALANSRLHTYTPFCYANEMAFFCAFAHFFSPLLLWHSFSSSHLSLFGSTIYLFGWFLYAHKRIQLQTSLIFFPGWFMRGPIFVPRCLNFQCFAFALFMQHFLREKNVVGLFFSLFRFVFMLNQCI